MSDSLLTSPNLLVALVESLSICETENLVYRGNEYVFLNRYTPDYISALHYGM